MQNKANNSLIISSIFIFLHYFFQNKMILDGAIDCMTDTIPQAWARRAVSSA
jgi:hypothetical protein